MKIQIKNTEKIEKDATKEWTENDFKGVYEEESKVES